MQRKLISNLVHTGRETRSCLFLPRAAFFGRVSHAAVGRGLWKVSIFKYPLLLFEKCDKYLNLPFTNYNFEPSSAKCETVDRHDPKDVKSFASMWMFYGLVIVLTMLSTAEVRMLLVFFSSPPAILKNTLPVTAG